MEQDEKVENISKQVKNETEKVIENLIQEGIHEGNVDFLGKVVDIHKDFANEKYWKEKEEYYMRYPMYGRGSYGRRGDDRYDTYGRGRARDSRGRYKESGRYRGHEMIDNMYEDYGRYSEGKEDYNRGNYGAKEDTIKSLEYMMESVVCFVNMLKDEAGPEEMEIIKKYTREISEI